MADAACLSISIARDNATLRGLSDVRLNFNSSFGLHTVVSVAGLAHGILSFRTTRVHTLFTILNVERGCIMVRAGHDHVG